MNTTFNPNDSGGHGTFSELQFLARNMLQELGDHEASYFQSSQATRFILYANKIVGDVNRHPMFLDLLDNAYDNQVGNISADSYELTLTSSGTVFSQYTPVKIVGAGFDNTDTTVGDLYSFVIKQKTDSSGNAVANTYNLADTAFTTVSGAVVSHPYKTRIRRYTASTEYRAIDDEVMVAGLKMYFMNDDADTNNAGLITLNQSAYTNALNNWLGSITNIQGNLTVSINEYT